MNNPLMNSGPGYIEVICGCMYSGKTEELIRQLRRCDFARKPYRVFKPRLDNRYSEDEIASHSQQKIPSIVIDKIEEVFLHVESSTQVVAIDEAQFFGPEIVNVVSKLANHNRRVLVAGLDTDWQGRPFGPMPELLAVADIIRKQYAICKTCGESATRTQRLVTEEADILVGSFNLYEARCRAHFDPTLNQATRAEQSSAQPMASP